MRWGRWCLSIFPTLPVLTASTLSSFSPEPPSRAVQGPSSPQAKQLWWSEPVCVSRVSTLFLQRPYSSYFWLLRPPGLCCNCLAHPQATSGSCANKSLFTKPGEGDRFVPFSLPCALLLPLASGPGAECGLKPVLCPSPQPLLPADVLYPPSLGHTCFASCPPRVVSFAFPSPPGSSLLPHLQVPT